MKRFFYFAVVLILSSCLNEKNITPGKPSTFVRYFNGGNNDYAQLAEETADGSIIILGTTKITSASDSSKIKLIKTDRFGNTLSKLVYPEFGSSTVLAGNALLQLSGGGFIVAGTEITSSHTDLALIQVDDQLTTASLKKIDFTVAPYSITESVQSRAILLNKNGNYLVLASLQADTYNMLLAEIDKDFKIIWVKKYGAGTSVLDNKLFLSNTFSTDSLPDVYWSGTVTRNSTDIRLVKAAQNSINTIFDLPIGSPDFREESRDICQYGVGFVVVGNSSENGNQDILFKVLTQNGTELVSKTIIKSTNGEVYGDVDTGNAVCAATGGFVVLGTVKRAGQDDYFLMKYDGFGNEVWPEHKLFGNTTRNDAGASVRQLSDGSLLILGTTFFGGVNTMMLMKSDSRGNIE